MVFTNLSNEAGLLAIFDIVFAKSGSIPFIKPLIFLNTLFNCGVINVKNAPPGTIVR